MTLRRLYFWVSSPLAYGLCCRASAVIDLGGLFGDDRADTPGAQTCPVRARALIAQHRCRSSTRPTGADPRTAAGPSAGRTSVNRGRGQGHEHHQRQSTPVAERLPFVNPPRERPEGVIGGFIATTSGNSTVPLVSARQARAVLMHPNMMLKSSIRHRLHVNDVIGVGQAQQCGQHRVPGAVGREPAMTLPLPSAMHENPQETLLRDTTPIAIDDPLDHRRYPEPADPATHPSTATPAPSDIHPSSLTPHHQPSSPDRPTTGITLGTSCSPLSASACPRWRRTAHPPASRGPSKPPNDRRTHRSGRPGHRPAVDEPRTGLQVEARVTNLAANPDNWMLSGLATACRGQVDHHPLSRRW